MRHTDSGGHGEPLVLLHAGVFADWFARLDSEPALAGLRRIHVVRTGYADPPPAEPLSVADHADECAGLLRSLGVERAHVLAHSSGTVFALQLALDHPDLVGDHVLSDPPLIDTLLAPEDREAVGALLGPTIGAAADAVARGELGTAFDVFMTALCGPGYRSVVAAALGPDGLARAERDCGYFFTGEIPAVARWQFDDDLAKRIEQPVLLVAGGSGHPATRRLVEHLAGLLPDAGTVTVAGRNHLLPLQAPAELARLVRTFAPVR